MAALAHTSGRALHSLYVTAPAGTAELAGEELAACAVTDVRTSLPMVSQLVLTGVYAEN